MQLFIYIQTGLLLIASALIAEKVFDLYFFQSSNQKLQIKKLLNEKTQVSLSPTVKTLLLKSVEAKDPKDFTQMSSQFLIQVREDLAARINVVALIGILTGIASVILVYFYGIDQIIRGIEFTFSDSLKIALTLSCVVMTICYIATVFLTRRIDMVTLDLVSAIEELHENMYRK